MPTNKELQGIVDYSIAIAVGSTTIDVAFFPNTMNGAFWSSSSLAGLTAYGWDVAFDDGNVYGVGRFYYYAVRLVRAGQ